MSASLTPSELLYEIRNGCILLPPLNKILKLLRTFVKDVQGQQCYAQISLEQMWMVSRADMNIKFHHWEAFKVEHWWTHWFAGCIHLNEMKSTSIEINSSAAAFETAEESANGLVQFAKIITECGVNCTADSPPTWTDVAWCTKNVPNLMQRQYNALQTNK